MSISITLMGHHRIIAKRDIIKIPKEKINSVSDAFLFLKKIYPEIIINENTTLVTVNDKISHMDESIKANDNIAFLPVFGGG